MECMGLPCATLLGMSAHLTLALEVRCNHQELVLAPRNGMLQQGLRWVVELDEDLHHSLGLRQY